MLSSGLFRLDGLLAKGCLGQGWKAGMGPDGKGCPAWTRLAFLYRGLQFRLSSPCNQVHAC